MVVSTWETTHAGGLAQAPPAPRAGERSSESSSSDSSGSSASGERGNKEASRSARAAPAGGLCIIRFTNLGGQIQQPTWAGKADIMADIWRQQQALRQEAQQGGAAKQVAEDTEEQTGGEQPYKLEEPPPPPSAASQEETPQLYSPKEKEAQKAAIVLQRMTREWSKREAGRRAEVERKLFAGVANEQGRRRRIPFKEAAQQVKDRKRAVTRRLRQRKQRATRGLNGGGIYFSFGRGADKTDPQSKREGLRIKRKRQGREIRKEKAQMKGEDQAKLDAVIIK